MAQVNEIVDGIYRICSLPAGQYPVGFNQFLIDDEHPTLSLDRLTPDQGYFPSSQLAAA